MFQSSPAPEGECNCRPRRSLIPTGFNPHPPLRAAIWRYRNRLSGFNPHPPLRASATYPRSDCEWRFKRSPAGDHRPDIPVSILTRP